MRIGEDAERIIRFDDLFGSRMRQPTVADEDTESAGVEETLARSGDAIVDGGETHSVFRAMPPCPLQREPRRYCPVNIGELVSLDVACGFTDPRESAQLRRQLLLQVKAATDAPAVRTHGGDVGGGAGDRGELHGIVEQSHASAAVEQGEQEPTGTALDLMTLFEFEEGLKLVKSRIKMRAVRHRG